MRYTLATVDEIVIVAEPDLANLRNAKNLADTFKALRPAETEPLLVINKIGVPRRPEISANEFATSVECKLLGQITFDAAIFGTAANNGQMIAEVAANNQAATKSIALDRAARHRPHARPKPAAKAGQHEAAGRLFKKRKRA